MHASERNEVNGGINTYEAHEKRNKDSLDETPDRLTRSDDSGEKTKQVQLLKHQK